METKNGPQANAATAPGKGGFPMFASPEPPLQTPVHAAAEPGTSTGPAAAPAPADETIPVKALVGTTAGALATLPAGTRIPAGMSEAQAMAVIDAFGLDVLEEMAAAGPDANVDIHDADGALGKSFPRIAIEHCMSEQTASLQRGWITDLLTLEQHKSLDVVLLARKRGRIMWPPREQGQDVSRQPSCTSNDCIRRSGGSTEEIPADQACLRCPFAQWSTGQKGERIPPACAETFVDLLWDVAAGYPRILTSKRAGAKALSRMRDELKFSGVLAVRKLGLPPQFPWSLAVAFALCGVPAKSKRGEPYFVPGLVKGSIRPLDMAAVQEMYAAFKVLRPAFVDQDIGEQAGGEEEAAADDDAGHDVHDGSGGQDMRQFDEADRGEGPTTAGGPVGGGQTGGQPSIQRFGNRG